MKTLKAFILISTLWLSLPLAFAQPQFEIANFISTDTSSPANFNLEIKPGEKANDAIIIANKSPDEVLNIKIFSSDAAPSNTGALALKKETDEQPNLGKWINFQIILIQFMLGKQLPSHLV